MGRLLHSVQRRGALGGLRPHPVSSLYQMQQPTHQRSVYQLYIIRCGTIAFALLRVNLYKRGKYWGNTYRCCRRVRSSWSAWRRTAAAAAGQRSTWDNDISTNALSSWAPDELMTSSGIPSPNRPLCRVCSALSNCSCKQIDTDLFLVTIGQNMQTVGIQIKQFTTTQGYDRPTLNIRIYTSYNIISILNR